MNSENKQGSNTSSCICFAFILTISYSNSQKHRPSESFSQHIHPNEPLEEPSRIHFRPHHPIANSRRIKPNTMGEKKGSKIEIVPNKQTRKVLRQTHTHPLQSLRYKNRCIENHRNSFRGPHSLGVILGTRHVIICEAPFRGCITYPMPAIQLVSLVLKISPCFFFSSFSHCYYQCYFFRQHLGIEEHRRFFRFVVVVWLCFTG